MPSLLLPERPLLISPTLAATIGLEEAVMLHVLAELLTHDSKRIKDRLKWLELDDSFLCEACPFWLLIDIKRILNSLQNLGMVIIDPETGNEDSYYLAINQEEDSAESEKPAPSTGIESTGIKSTEITSTRVMGSGHNQNHNTTRYEENPHTDNRGKSNVTQFQGASYMTANWQPEQDWIVQCRRQNISEEFIRSSIPRFVMYWRDRGQVKPSWGNVFYQHVVREWRKDQSHRGIQEMESEMSRQWWPSEDALMIMGNDGVDPLFIENAVPEFVLYWRERGIVNSTWNSKFISHVRRQWHKFSNAVGDDMPRPISDEWEPSPECFEIIGLAEIDEGYARGKVKEFVLYWKDANQVHASWNIKFLSYIKHSWATRSKDVGSGHAENQSIAGASQEKVSEIYERFSDRTWAD